PPRATTAGPARSTVWIQARRRCRAQRAGQRVIRRYAGHVAATDRMRAESARAGTAIVSSRLQVPPRTARLPLLGPRPAPERVGGRARSMCQAALRPSPQPAPPALARL